MTQKGCTGYRFDTFEVKLTTDKLLRKGQPVRIQQLPFQMLVVLLEHAGNPVSREELRNRLWNDQTFLEFDNNLRVAAAKLREALGDQATQPRFIKTIARKGYEFIGEAVALFEQPESTARVGSPADPAVGPVSPRSVELSPALPGPRSYRVSVIAGAAILLLALALAACTFWYAQRPLNRGNGKITLGGIANDTGETAFDGTLSTAFRFKIEESPYLNLVQDQDFRRAAPLGDGTSARAQELSACRMLGAVLLLDGSISRRAANYRINIDAWQCRDPSRLASVTSEADSQLEVLPALDRAIEKMRRRLGEPESSLAKYTEPLTQATTSSLFALKSLTLGDEKLRRGQVVPSISDYKMAIDLDPQFALAYARLGAAYTNAREYSEARDSSQKAFDLRERTTDRERLYIAAHYYATVTGELPREIEAYQLWRTVYPRDVVPVDNLVNIYLTLGQVDKALDLASTAVEIAPSSQAAHALQARAYLGMGRYDRLNQLCTDPTQNRTDLVLFHTTCYLAAFAQKNEAAEQRELLWSEGNPQVSVMLEWVAWGEVYRGKLAEARQTFARARQSAIQNHAVDFAAELDLDEALQDADLGLAQEAHTHALDALSIAPNAPSVPAMAALVLARAGDVAQAEVEASYAARQSANANTRNATLMAYTRSALQLKRQDAPSAVQSMEGVRAFDQVGYMALAPAYYRGLALLEDRRPGDAAREFQQVIDHAALDPASVYGELARLELGRVLARAGNAVAAEQQYQVLDVLWREADPDFPPLADLHREERRVRGRH